MKKNLSKKKKVGATIAVFAAAVLFISSCATTTKADTTSFIKTMIQFDQAFIPALAMTSKGDISGSVKAMDILENEWATLKPELIGFYPDDSTVADKLASVDSSIMAAKNKLASGEPLLEVHETLEGVKKPFVDIRAAKNISYYPDLLDAYHTIMEEIITLTTDKKASDITAEDMETILDLASKGVKQWGIIQKSKFDSKLFGFSETKTKGLVKSIESGKSESIKFQSIVKSGEKEAMLKEAAGLKPYYTKVYLQFGNFTRLKG